MALCEKMIDRESRNKFCELIRSLTAGLITNDEFEDRLSLIDFEDKAIWGVFHYGAWSLYSDLKEYKLEGNEALRPEERAYVTKLVLFLKSDYEYEWPDATRKKSVLYRFTFGMFGEIAPDPWLNVGEEKYWPFLNKKQYEHAKSNYGYLGISST